MCSPKPTWKTDGLSRDDVDQFEILNGTKLDLKGYEYKGSRERENTLAKLLCAMLKTLQEYRC